MGQLDSNVQGPTMEGTTSRVRTTETSKVSVGGAAAQTAEATMKTAQAGPSGMRSGAPRTLREEAYRVPQPLMRQLVKAAEPRVEELLSRETYPLPTLAINPAVDNLFDFVFDDFELLDYQSHGPISAPVAV